MDEPDKERSRAEILSALSRKPEQSEGNINFYHGRMKHFLPSSVPHTTWRCSQVPRRKTTPAWLTATEFSDQKEILHEKVSLLAKLMKNSRRTVLFTGAGISTSAGVRQSALGQTGQGYGGRGYQTDAKPNFSNLALTALGKLAKFTGFLQ